LAAAAVAKRTPPRPNSAFFVKKFRFMSPSCDTCVHFMPHLAAGESKYHLGKCALFGSRKELEFAMHCRRNAHQCGPMGSCHEENRDRFLQ
jgi:hypothetical protein